MTKFSYLYLVAVFSCVIIHAADQGSAAPYAGTKRRAAVSVCPSTPISTPKLVRKYSPGRGVHDSAMCGVPADLQKRFPDALDTDVKRAGGLLILEDASKYSSPERESVGRILNGMVDYEVARPALEAAAAAGAAMPAGQAKAIVVAGHYAEQASRKHANVGVKQGAKRAVKLFDVTDAIVAVNCPVTPAVDLGHMTDAPVIENNGTLTGGHALSGYIRPFFTMLQQVNLLDHKGAAAIEVAYTPSKKGELVKGKTVWFGEEASKAAVAQRVLDAEIIGVNSQGNRHLLQSPDGPCIAFLKGRYSYGSVFPTRFIRANELASREIVLGTSDGGAQVIISSEDVKRSIREQLRIDTKITSFKDSKGVYILSGVEIPGLPSGGSVELTADLQKELLSLLPDVPEMVSPVKTGTLIKFKSTTPSSMSGGAATSAKP